MSDQKKKVLFVEGEVWGVASKEGKKHLISTIADLVCGDEINIETVSHEEAIQQVQRGGGGISAVVYFSRAMENEAKAILTLSGRLYNNAPKVIVASALIPKDALIWIDTVHAVPLLKEIILEWDADGRG